MPASLAIEMGVPIYGIVALTNTATDKEGRSVPAPGQGILTTARELKMTSRPHNGFNTFENGFSKEPHQKSDSPILLSLDYRKRQMNLLRKKINDWVKMEHEHVQVNSLFFSFLLFFLKANVKYYFFKRRKLN